MINNTGEDAHLVAELAVCNVCRGRLFNRMVLKT